MAGEQYGPYQDTGDWLDKVLVAGTKITGSFFDYFTSKNEAEASANTRAAEELKASYIDQLAKYASTGGKSVSDALSTVPSWMLSAAVLGFGSIVAMRLMKK